VFFLFLEEISGGRGRRIQDEKGKEEWEKKKKKKKKIPVGGHLLDPLFFMIGGIPATFSLSSHFLVFIAI